MLSVVKTKKDYTSDDPEGYSTFLGGEGNDKVYKYLIFTVAKLN